MNFDELEKDKQEAIDALRDINNELFDCKQYLEELIDTVDSKLDKIYCDQRELSRKAFDLYFGAGLTIGQVFRIEGATVPQPLKIVGINCDGYVCIDANGEERPMQWKYAEKIIDRIRLEAEDADAE